MTREQLAPAAAGTLDRRPYWCDAPLRESPVGYLAEPPCRGDGALVGARVIAGDRSPDACLAARLKMDTSPPGASSGTHGHRGRASRRRATEAPTLDI